VLCPYWGWYAVLLPLMEPGKSCSHGEACRLPAAVAAPMPLAKDHSSTFTGVSPHGAGAGGIALCMQRRALA
jgi:hypothetical protein